MSVGIAKEEEIGVREIEESREVGLVVWRARRGRRDVKIENIDRGVVNCNGDSLDLEG